MPGWASQAIDLSVFAPETSISGIALLVTIAIWVADRYVVRRRRLVYRIQVDQSIGVTPKTAHMVAVEFRYRGDVVHDPSIVLVRVDNNGMDIEPGHIEQELEFRFPGRTITGLDVTEADPPAIGTILEERLDSADFIGTSRLVVPKTAINRGDSFKFLLVMSGTGTGVEHGGYLVGGVGGGVYHEPRPKGPGRRSLIFGSLSLLLVGALVALFIVDVVRPPDDCVSGQLRIVGSTAVEPVVKQVRSAYQAECTRTDIEVAASGSREGTRMVADAGRTDPGGAARLVAMSDGRAEEHGELHNRPVAAVVFAIVVNRSAGVTALTSTQVRDIYAGKVTTWDQVGGRAVPVRMVSRTGPDSGTRRVFRDKVLGGDSELGISATNCKDRDNPALRFYRCEVSTTDELLTRVNDLEGAIGYGDLGGSRKHTGLTVVTLDGVGPEPAVVANGRYRFWDIEYAYTAREPERDSLQGAFLDYLVSPRARPVLTGDGLIPCADLQTDLCK